jgi:predicted NBD/HSP70 family sugar kinase
LHTPVVLGLDFGGTKIAAAVSDCAGGRLGTTMVETAADRGAHVALEQGLGAVRALLVAIAIDPIRTAVGGGMVRSWQHIEGGLRRALDAAVPYPPELVRARFPYEAPLMGALALGTDAARQVLARGAPACVA